MYRMARSGPEICRTIGPASAASNSHPNSSMDSGRRIRRRSTSTFICDRYEVRDVTYRVHAKRDAPPDAPRFMRVDYRLGLDHWQSEWIGIRVGGIRRA